MGDVQAGLAQGTGQHQCQRAQWSPSEHAGLHRFAECSAYRDRATSNKVISDLGPEIHWLHSYVTQDKMYCVYVDPEEDIRYEHARCGGFPADRISKIAADIDPATGEQPAG